MTYLLTSETRFLIWDWAAFSVQGLFQPFVSKTHANGLDVTVFKIKINHQHKWRLLKPLKLYETHINHLIQYLKASLLIQQLHSRKQRLEQLFKLSSIFSINFQQIWIFAKRQHIKLQAVQNVQTLNWDCTLSTGPNNVKPTAVTPAWREVFEEVPTTSHSSVSEPPSWINLRRQS